MVRHSRKGTRRKYSRRRSIHTAKDSAHEAGPERRDDPCVWRAPGSDGESDAHGDVDQGDSEAWLDVAPHRREQLIPASAEVHLR